MRGNFKIKKIKRPARIFRETKIIADDNKYINVKRTHEKRK